MIIATITNGLCAVIQKAEQTAFNGQYENEFMIDALFLSAVILFVISLIFERKYIIPSMKFGAVQSLLCGVSNALTNLLVTLIKDVVAVCDIRHIYNNSEDMSFRIFKNIFCTGIIILWDIFSLLSSGIPYKIILHYKMKNHHPQESPCRLQSLRHPCTLKTEVFR